MRRWHVGCLLVLAAAVAGCGVQPSGVITGAAPPSGEVREAMPITLYLVSNGRLEMVRRPGAPLAQAGKLDLLAAGPTGEERARGLGTAVPADAAPFSVSLDPSGRIVVTLSSAADALPAIAADQVVCTVTATGPVERARVVLLGAGSSLGPRTCPAPG